VYVGVSHRSRRCTVVRVASGDGDSLVVVVNEAMNVAASRWWR